MIIKYVNSILNINIVVNDNTIYIIVYINEWSYSWDYNILNNIIVMIIINMSNINIHIINTNNKIVNYHS